MKLFLSYSRDDKAWTYELWRNLRDELHHDAWIDRRLIPAQDWWGAICEAIEQADVFVYVMSPKAIESIYCTGELNYALALNKPILPLMLKPCDFPNALSKRRVQFQTITDDLSMDKVLLRITMGLMGIQQQTYEPKDAPRPDVPSPQQNAEHIFEAFALAEEAASEGNITLAEQFFAQVIDADPDGLGLAAKERLDEIMQEQDRAKAYHNVKRLAGNSVTIKGAKAAWRSFKRIYGEYDPDNLNATLSNTNQGVAKPKPKLVEQVQRPQITTPSNPASKDLMPDPFDWIEIPAGRGTMKTDDGTSLAIPTEPYWMSKYPVTNAQFREFVDVGGYNTEKWWTKQGWEYRQKDNWNAPRFWDDSKWNSDIQPVVGVSWFESVAFCLWLSDKTGENIMLPTEAQWQYAAQGKQGYTYPWGNDWNPELCNNNVGNGIRKTSPVTQYDDKGNSPFGVADMAGNVWEWCLTDYNAQTNDFNSNATRRVLRGGSWNYYNTDFFHCVFRFRYYPHIRYDDLGFRVSRF